MKFIDFHVDTLYRLYYQIGGALGNLSENNCHVDFKRLRSSGYAAQVFACFVNLAKPSKLDSHYEDVLAMITYFYEQLKTQNFGMAYASDFSDYKANSENNYISAILSVEEGGILEGEIDRLDVLYDKGVRMMNLTWNHENCIAYPHGKSAFKSKGLKPFGIELVEKMDEMGMIVDVSHLSDGGFKDVVEHSKRPFVATHSNARSLCSASRNLTDDMIKQIADAGGIIGLNFYSKFLGVDSVSRVSDILKHCRYIQKVGGDDVLSLGTDFDGMTTPLEIDGAKDMPSLAEAMQKNGFTYEQAAKICFKNAEDFFERYRNTATQKN